MTKNKCTQCGDKYKKLGVHWARSSTCDYPDLTQHQREITVGLVMGDGYIDRNMYTPRLISSMTSPNYLKHIDEQFGVLGSGVSLRATAEENAKRKRDSGFDKNANSENYSDMYEWKTRTNPEFAEFSNWYSSGKKVWPKTIKLTPTVLKHWYCGDGNWHNSGSRNYIRIGMKNEINNTEKVDRLFEQSGLPTPSNYNTYEMKSGVGCTAAFTVSHSKELWEYMGEPLPDFSYKWPEEY